MSGDVAEIGVRSTGEEEDDDVDWSLTFFVVVFVVEKKPALKAEEEEEEDPSVVRVDRDNLLLGVTTTNAPTLLIKPAGVTVMTAATIVATRRRIKTFEIIVPSFVRGKVFQNASGGIMCFYQTGWY